MAVRLKAAVIVCPTVGVTVGGADVGGVVAKIHEELDEIRAALEGGNEAAIREELGDLLFAVVNLARFRRVDSEDALDRATAKFMRRFREVERRVRAEGRDLKQCTLEELDAHWEAAKAAERSGAPSGGVAAASHVKG